MKHLYIFITAFLITMTSFSQNVIPHLSFRNPVLVSGTALADNSVYRFPTVTAGVDALVKINGRSSTNVVLSDIDINNTGYDSAFQPLVNYTNGSNIKSNVVTDWYLEFQISFVTAGTSSPTTVAAFNATGLDDDGNSDLHEYLSFYGLNTYTLETPTALTVSNITSGSTVLGKRFDGATTEYAGIDVTATSAMVTTSYVSTSVFTIRTGGKATGPINISNNGRQYSLWFKSFNYSTPVIQTLPVDLVSFNASLNGPDKVILNWATSLEKNSSHFVIERSFDGKSFDDAGLVFSNENSSATETYSFTDNIPSANSGLIYYRLKMVDMDNSFKYSDVVVVRIQKDQQFTLLAFPNPAISELRVTIPDSWQNKTVAYSIYSLSGSLVKFKINSNAGQTESLNIADLPSGSYIIRTTNGNQNATQKFMKMN
jgi:hypothetical protein